MYWNNDTTQFATDFIKININMRCIEMITKQDIFEMYPD